MDARNLITEVASRPVREVHLVDQQELLHAICQELVQLRRDLSTEERKHSFIPEEQA